MFLVDGPIRSKPNLNGRRIIRREISFVLYKYGKDYETNYRCVVWLVWCLYRVYRLLKTATGFL